MTRVLLTLCALCIAGSAAASGHSSLQEARDLYFQAKVGDAEAAFNAIELDPATSAPDRRRAYDGSARIAWLVDGDAPRALAALDRAIATGGEVCASEMAAVRILREAHRLDDAIQRAQTATAHCTSAAGARDLAIESVRAQLERIPSQAGAARAASLNAIAAILRANYGAAAVDPDIQSLALELALDEGDADKALDAWRGFFWLTDRSAPSGMQVSDATVVATFREGLAHDAGLPRQVALLRLLLHGGFHPQALRFDELHGIATKARSRADYVPVAAYFHFRRALDAASLVFHRATARGHGDGKAYEQAVEALHLELAHAIDPKATDAAPVLAREFGIFGTFGKTSGYESLHEGHLVQDDLMQVDQFGRHGEVRFVVIDNMIANGFQSWLWDGDASTGGWATPERIVQVRPSYTAGTLVAFAALDPEAVRRADTHQVELDQADRDALEKSAIAFLPGVQARLERHAREQVAADTRQKVLVNHQPFAKAFVEAYWNASIDHSIRIHEGRHVLDRLSYQDKAALDDPELEYRAKLSQLELAKYPRMALANILSANIGDTSPHGVGNARVIAGLKAWIEAHAAQVNAYDAGEPALLQLDKLTDDQLRAYAKGVDPQLAGGK